MRPIKFRGKRVEGVDGGKWVYGYYSEGEQGGATKGFISASYWDYHYQVIPETVCQFTGHQLKEVDLYEGDVIRVEENAEGVDPEDIMNWYVVTFVRGWCMFAMLHTDNEYFQYLKDGEAELDEFMFWTFPLDHVKGDQYFLCGNIHDHPDLLLKTSI